MDAPFDPFRSGYPLRGVLDCIGDRWTILILSAFADGKRWRFGALVRHIKGISQKMLTQTLRSLEMMGSSPAPSTPRFRRESNIT